MIIYKTTNLINNKIYIGKDSKNNPNYLGSGKILSNAIKKYGKNNFKKEILESCTLENLNEREIYWIDFYKANNEKIGYNILSGGDGGDTFSFQEIEKKKRILEKRKNTMLLRYGGAVNKGKKLTDEEKAKLKGKNLGKKHPNRKKVTFTEEHKQNIAKANKERCAKLSDEEKLNIAQSAINSNKGRKVNEETKKKMSESAKGNQTRFKVGHKHSEETKQKMRKPRTPVQTQQSSVRMVRT